jgi:D-arabinose 1-dehydrogenase-like Zn-dependent alcohol dehydrogenase
MELRAPGRSRDKPDVIRVGEVPDPTPGEGEVVVKVGACGICGSDLNIAAGNFPPTPFPIVPGHDVMGVAVARPGWRVAQARVESSGVVSRPTAPEGWLSRTADQL